jgi:hypothetical protein
MQNLKIDLLARHIAGKMVHNPEYVYLLLGKCVVELAKIKKALRLESDREFRKSMRALKNIPIGGEISGKK